MVKAYLRYKPRSTFGVISSPSSNAVFDATQKLAVSASLFDVIVWNIATSEIVNSTLLLTIGTSLD